MIDLDMGRYAAFVWPAWLLSAAVLAGLAARALIAARRWSMELKRLENGPADLGTTGSPDEDRP
jgi:heme exporter protein D